MCQNKIFPNTNVLQNFQIIIHCIDIYNFTQQFNYKHWRERKKKKNFNDLGIQTVTKSSKIIRNL